MIIGGDKVSNEIGVDCCGVVLLDDENMAFFKVVSEDCVELRVAEVGWVCVCSLLLDFFEARFYHKLFN